MNQQKKVKVLPTIWIPESQHNQFKSKVSAEGKNMTTKIKQWVKEYVEGKETKNTPDK
jgi:hypothetical protein